jgi:hypothetical protein
MLGVGYLWPHWQISLAELICSSFACEFKLVCRDVWVLRMLRQIFVAWHLAWRQGSQLGAKSLRSHWGLCIVLNADPCIIVLVVSLPLCFENSKTRYVELYCNSRIYVITLLFRVCVCDVLLCNYYFYNDAPWWSWWDWTSLFKGGMSQGGCK